MGKHKGSYRAKDTRRSRVALVKWVTLIYAVTLVGLVAVTLRFHVPLFQGQETPAPTPWLVTLNAFYYAVPFLLAVILGVVFRPFGPHFRNLLVSILVIQGIYSVVIFAWRYQYLETQRDRIHKVRVARAHVKGFRPQFHDADKDGVVDDIKLSLRLDMTEFVAGQYELKATITQRGQSFPDSDIGSFAVALTEAEEGVKFVVAEFHFNPQLFESYFESGEFEMNLHVRGVPNVDREGRRIMAFNRWSPFLRNTSWAGDDDPDILPAKMDLEYLPRVGTFALLPIDFKRPQVIFNRFEGDFGRDTDGDGGFEALVIGMDMTSKYEGVVFVQASIPGGAYPIFHESALKVGRNRLEFIVPGRYLRELGRDGPYELVDFQLFNKNPGCHTQECLKKIKPFFTVYIDDYMTQRYSWKQFR